MFDGLMSRCTTPCECAYSSARQTDADAQRLVGRHLALAHDHRLEGHALDVLHDQAQPPARLGEVVEVDDVRVLELGQDARLLDEARLELLVDGELGREDLDGDGLPGHAVIAAIDHAHAARAQHRLELEVEHAAADEPLRSFQPPDLFRHAKTCALFLPTLAYI
jgi:hypothetical protein